MSTQDSEIRSKLTETILGSKIASEEQYVDNKAKFIIDDLEPVVTDLINQEALALLDRLEKEAVENVNGVKIIGLRHVEAERSKYE
jgi:hypothetical protein